MLQLGKKIIILIFLLVLTACSTTSNKENTHEDKKTKTALINTQLGLGYLQKRDMQRAKTKLLAAMKEAPQLPDPWYAMAYYQEMTGETASAKKYYEKAISIAPNRGDVLNNYGTFLCRSGDYKGAIQYFLKATQDIEYLETASAYENAGLCAMKIPDHKLAIAYFNKAILHDPNSPIALIELAENDYQEGDYSDAQTKLDEYIAIAPPTAQSQALKAKLEKKEMQNGLSTTIRTSA